MRGTDESDRRKFWTDGMPSLRFNSLCKPSVRVRAGGRCHSLLPGQLSMQQRTVPLQPEAMGREQAAIRQAELAELGAGFSPQPGIKR